MASRGALSRPTSSNQPPVRPCFDADELDLRPHKLVRADSALFGAHSKKTQGGNAELVGQRINGVESEVPLSPLDPGQVPWSDAELLCQPLLR